MYVPLRCSRSTPLTSKPTQCKKSLHKTPGTRPRWLFPQLRLQGLGMRFHCGKPGLGDPARWSCRHQAWGRAGASGGQAARYGRWGRQPGRLRGGAAASRRARGRAGWWGQSARRWLGRGVCRRCGPCRGYWQRRAGEPLRESAAPRGLGAGAAGPGPAEGVNFAAKHGVWRRGAGAGSCSPGRTPACRPRDRVPPPLPPSTGGSRVARRSRRSVFPAAARCGGQGRAACPLQATRAGGKQPACGGWGRPAGDPAGRAKGEVRDRPVFNSGTRFSVLRRCSRVFVQGLLPTLSPAAGTHAGWGVCV